jgi:hypothetical protein
MANSKSVSFTDSLSNRLLLIFISLCSVWFFRLRGLGKGERVFELLGIALIIVFLFFYYLYDKNSLNVKRNFGLIILFLSSILISSFSCYYFNNQSIPATLYQSKPEFYVLFYFLLHFLNLKPEWIKEFIFYFAMIAGLVYIMQYFAFPTKITEAKMFIDRGTLRINLPASAFRDLGFFMCIDMFYRTNKSKYAIGAMLLLSVAIISAFRSVIALYVGLAVIYLLINNKVKNKFMMIIMFVIVMISGFFVFQNIFIAMSKSSQKESSQGKDYVRLQAGNYYFSQITNRPVAGILGNGAPDPSTPYGARTDYYILKHAYYLSDIGLIGSFYKYGLLFVLVSFFILMRLLFIKVSTDLNFIKLFAVMQLLVFLTTFPIFEDESGIVIICLMFYLVDCDLTKNKELVNLKNV